ncbi:response regulator [Acetobacterium sp.]|uniref:response regulator n=1 Tax=Acetobacterium sp. TaxID=1872094 RepID=UPI0035935B3C
MFRIGICDDQRAICSQIEGIILENQNTFVEQVEIDVFYSGEKLAEFIKNEHDFDLVFLDIEMEGLNGLDLGRKIREEMDNQTMQIIYVSGKESYYKDLFDVRCLSLD